MVIGIIYSYVIWGRFCSALCTFFNTVMPNGWQAYNFSMGLQFTYFGGSTIRLLYGTIAFCVEILVEILRSFTRPR